MEFTQIEYLNLEKNEQYEDIIKQVITTCFGVENLTQRNLYISVTLTIPEEIRKINKEHRNIDKPTDVLSFPMFTKQELEQLETQDNGYDILGDIAISIPRVEEQAQEYGHSFQRELAYMVVHGFYHLMGYDHIQEEDRKQMRLKEEYVLGQLKLVRE